MMTDYEAMMQGLRDKIAKADKEAGIQTIKVQQGLTQIEWKLPKEDAEKIYEILHRNHYWVYVYSEE